MTNNRRRWLIVAVAVLVSAVLAGGIVLHRRERRLAFERRLAEELARIRQTGRPATIEDLIEPDIPDDENAAILYAEAFELIEPLSNDREKRTALAKLCYRPGASGLTPGQVDQTRAFLETHGDALSLIEEGNRRPRFRWPRNWHKTFAVEVPPSLCCLLATKMLMIRARLALAEGRVEDAVEDIRTGARLSRHILGDRPLASQMIAHNLVALILDEIHELLSMHCLNTHILDTLSGEIKPIEEIDRLADALACQRVTWCETASRFWEKRGTLSSLTQNVELFGPRGTIGWLREGKSCHPEVRLAYVELMSRLEELSRLPYYEAKNELDAWAREVEGHRIPHIRFFLAGQSRPLSFRALSLGRQRGMLQALAAEKERVLEGRFPADPPLGLVDPFDGKPLRYRLEEGALVILSVGEDLVDDNGAPLRHVKSRGMVGDIVWRIPN